MASEDGTDRGKEWFASIMVEEMPDEAKEKLREERDDG